MNMTSKQVAERLGVNEKYVRKSKGMYRYHQSYYWGLLNDPKRLLDLVKLNIPTAVIVDSGNHYHDFVGGAESGSAKDSFMWVKFTV